MFAKECPHFPDEMRRSAQLAVAGVSEEEVKLTLAKILASDLFSRSRSMCRLLRYLIEQGLHGQRSKTTEFAIGLEVYHRDPGTWYPALDPVVKTAIVHLRFLLGQFYSRHPAQVPVHFTIPFGNYCPEFQRIN